jgi:hypothetical protein
VDPISRSSTPGSDATVRQPPTRNNPGPYRNNRFAESSGSSRTLLSGVAPPQREQPRSDAGEWSPSSCIYLLLTNLDATSTVSTVVSHNREPHPERSSVGGPVVSPFVLVADAAVINAARARDDSTHQLPRPASTPSLRSSRSRQIEPDTPPQIDADARNQPRQSRFHIRQRLGIRL